MILAGQAVAQLVPHRRRHVEIVTRQHDRALRQPRRGVDQLRRCPARAGGARDDHRMLRRRQFPQQQALLHGDALQRAGVRGLVRGVEIALHDAQEPQRALPVSGLVGHVQRLDDVGRHVLDLHLVHQRDEAVGQIEQRGARSEIGLRVEQGGHEPDQLQPPSQGRHRLGQHQIGRGEVGQQPDARQESGRPRVEDVVQPAAHPLRVDDQFDPRDRFGRLAGEARPQPRHQRGGKIDSRVQPEEARRAVFKHPATGFRQARCPRGVRRRTSGPDRSGRKAAPVPASGSSRG